VDYKEYSEQLRILGKRYMDESTTAWQRYAKVMGDASSGKWNIDDLQKRFTQFVQTEGTEYTRKCMQCNIDYYMGLMNAGLEFSNQMFDSVFSPAAAKPAEKQPSAEEAVSARKQETSRTRTEIHFVGKHGDMPKQAFVVANKQSQDVEVSFEISEFVSEDGKSKNRIAVLFKPEHFVLKQGEEQVVECQMTIDETLSSEQQHAAIARVVGFPDMLLRLIVTIEN
jgi:hypothetical protein